MKKIHLITSLVVSSLVLFSACTMPSTTSQTSSNTKSLSTSKVSSSTGGTAEYTLAEIQSHGTSSDCWQAIDGSVYDLTSYVTQHPGGVNELVKGCGKDATALFNRVRQHRSTETEATLATLKIGTLKTN